MLERTLKPSRPLSLRTTLSLLRHGKNDPCNRFEAAGFWRATRTPSGPATLVLDETSAGVRGRAWGPGAEHVLNEMPELVGEHQEDGLFAPEHTVVKDLHHRLQGFRIPRGGRVFEALLPSILEQRVTGMEAKHSYARFVRTFGEPAPFSDDKRAPVMLAPGPDVVAEIPPWAFHRFGVEQKRAIAIRNAATRAGRLEEAADMEPAEARLRLTSVSGIGPWTAAEVALSALGDADAVSIGDYHLANWVAWALAGEPRGDDRRMLELLEPFRGQRGRVTRMIFLGHGSPPKYGPKYSPLPIASM